MNLSVKELNELIYSLGITASKGLMCDKELNVSLLNKMYDELNRKLQIKSDYNEVISKLKNIEIEEPKFRGEGTAQAVLDYVDKKGAVSHKELHEYYKSLNGSNTFSWCLRNLRIPYKNRKTQRYLAKEGKIGSNAKWVVKVANPSNWVVKQY